MSPASPTSPASPVVGAVEIAHADAGATTGRVRVSGAEPVFAGHYPGFPIFPGVCVVECAHRTAISATPAGSTRLRLAAIESTRFLSPVFPDDEVTAEITWRAAGDGWQARAAVATARGTAAQVRLRYQSEAS